jgi:hypothetical protein
MKKFIFTLCAIAFASFLVQAQDTPSVDDATITVKKIEKKSKASYTDSYNADDDTKKVVVKKAAYSGSTNTLNTNSKKPTLTKAAYSQKNKVGDDAALTRKNNAAKKNKVVKTKVTKSKARVKVMDSDDDDENNNK